MQENLSLNNIFTYRNHIITKKKELLKTIKDKKNLKGQFSFFIKDKQFIYMGRDEMGTKKMFFTFKKNKIFHSKNFLDLTKIKKIDLNKIYSVPQNSIIKIKKNKIVNKTFFKKNFHKKNKINLKNEEDIELKKFFKILNKQYKSVIILLSGGLDSAIIANYAKKYFKKNCYALTASYSPKTSLKKKIISQDLKVSKSICEKLDINHLNVFFDDNFIKKNLVKILYSCQDWRDYNVHCAVINFACANYIKKNFKDKNIAVITGDFMNEYFSDYDQVIVKNKIYYKQLKKNNKIKQRFFIKGLDSSARETGVFNFFKIPIFQPYHCVKSFYELLSLNNLKNKKSKYKFNKKFLPDKIFKIVNYSKIRAQHDPITGGVIGYFYKKNINQNKLIKIFNKNFKTNNLFLKNFINLGSYKTLIN